MSLHKRIFSIFIIITLYGLLSCKSDLLTEEERRWVSENEIILTPFISYPPLDFMDDDLVQQGIASEIIQTLEKTLDISIKRVYLNTWEEMINSLKTGRSDIIATIQNTTERQKSLLFTDPYMTFPAVIIIRNDQTGRSGLDDLSGLHVGIIKGFAINRYIEEQNPEINLIEVDSVVEGLQKTTSGLLDAFISDTAITSHYIRKLGISTLKISGEIDYIWNICMATSRENSILHGILEKGLESISYRKKRQIIDKWMHFDSIPFYRNDLFIRFAVIFFISISVLMLMFFIWNKQLVLLVNKQNRELRLNEIRLETLVSLGHMEADSLQKITDFALEEAVKLTESSIGYIAFLNDDESILTMNSWSRNAMKICAMRDKPLIYMVERTGLWGEAVRQRKPIITNNYDAPNSAKKGYPPGHIRIRRHMNAPIFDGEKIVAVAGVGNKKEIYNDGDVRQLTLLMDGLWKIIQQWNVKEEMQNLRTYLSSILDSMPSIIIAVDKDFNVIRWNHRASEWSGFKFNDIRGRDFSIILPMLDSHRNVLKHSIESHEVFTEHNIFFQIDNRKLIIDLTIYPLENSGEDGAVIRIDDVTDAHYLMEQINHSSKMDALGQLSGGIAHDFNNMLAGIMNAAELMKSKNIKYNIENSEYIDMILNASTRAADLTGKLLAFSRKEEFDKKDMDLNILIDETLSILTRTVNKNISIMFDKERETFFVSADYSSLQNVLINLAINASHAMPDGGVISIKTRKIKLEDLYCRTSVFDIQPGDFCDVEFKDTGFGIPKHVQERIFEPFFSTKEPGKGTGLGLATAYRTIQNHNGAINVNSEPGKGTIFHILLPLRDTLPIVIPQLEEELYGSGRILLVDDEPIILETGKLLLSEMGFQVSTASNGKDAIELFQKDPMMFKLVILDMLMPVLDGRQTFIRIKEMNEDCRVILSSGYVNQEDLDFLNDAGLNGYIRKPYTRANLMKVLNDVTK